MTKRTVRRGLATIIALLPLAEGTPAHAWDSRDGVQEHVELSDQARAQNQTIVQATRPPRPGPSRRTPAASPLDTLNAANSEARRRPDPEGFRDATQVYDYAPGALYEIYASPGYLSTILLEPGETVATVAAGDTTRWMLETATAGQSDAPQALLLLKPTRAGIRTNIVLVTDRRTYLIEAIAAQGSAYSAQTAWRYPASIPPQRHIAEMLTDINFRYRIETVRGRDPRWLPLRVFDDGLRTYVEFPLDIATSEAPPLFLMEEGEMALVNYRIVDNRYIIDRLFDVAELRLGSRRPVIVRIRRERTLEETGQR